mmetsp:Transcript_12960/g.22416  ORF Transcript_12960/g.22416 Transcript_12960/m.22416 type:complete len:208 (+) Transcript_12960:541-1164(+)
MVGFVNNLLSVGIIGREVVHSLAVSRLESAFVSSRDSAKLVKFKPAITQIHCFLRNVFQDLSTGKVTKISSVGMSHKQTGIVFADFMNSGNIFTSRRGADGLAFPLVSVVKLQVVRQGLFAIQLLKVDGLDKWMLFVPGHFLLYGRVHVVQVRHKLSVGRFLNQSIKKSSNEADVFSHVVGLGGPFLQFLGQGSLNLLRLRGELNTL